MAKPAAIKPVSEVQAWVRLMMVAGSGWGKTVMAGTAPNCLFLGFDPEGTESAAAQGSTAEVWQIKSWKEYETAYNYLLNGGGTSDYDWLVIDTMNEAQKYNQDGILAAPNRSQKSDPDILAQQDYQRNQIAMVKMVKQFNDLPINIIWNVQWTQQDYDGEPGFRYEPMIHGQRGDLAEQIKGYMKTVGYGTWVDLDYGGERGVIKTRRVHFAQTPPFMGRDRTGKLPATMDNPTVPKIIAALAQPTPAARKVGAPRKAAPKKAAQPPRKPPSARR